MRFPYAAACPAQPFHKNLPTTNPTHNTITVVRNVPERDRGERNGSQNIIWDLPCFGWAGAVAGKKEFYNFKKKWGTGRPRPGIARERVRPGARARQAVARSSCRPVRPRRGSPKPDMLGSNGHSGSAREFMVGTKISGLTGGPSYCQPGGAGHASLSSTLLRLSCLAAPLLQGGKIRLSQPIIRRGTAGSTACTRYCSLSSHARRW